MKKDNNMNNNRSTQVIATVLAIAILVIAVIGITYAAFTYSKAGVKGNTITTGTITMVYTEGKNYIDITNAMPIEDTIGEKFTKDNISNSGEITEGAAGVFDFSVTASITGNTTIKYDVIAVKQEDSTLDEKYAKLYLEKSITGADSGLEPSMTSNTFDKILKASESASTNVGKTAGANARVLHTDTFTTGEDMNHYYRLRMWVAKDFGSGDSEGESFASAKNFKIKVNVYGEAA